MPCDLLAAETGRTAYRGEYVDDVIEASSLDLVSTMQMEDGMSLGRVFLEIIDNGMNGISKFGVLRRSQVARSLEKAATRTVLLGVAHGRRSEKIVGRFSIR
jgi:hypothetical protein